MVGAVTERAQGTLSLNGCAALQRGKNLCNPLERMLACPRRLVAQFISGHYMN